jgi:hypothetical protein
MRGPSESALPSMGPHPVGHDQVPTVDGDPDAPAIGYADGTGRAVKRVRVGDGGKGVGDLVISRSVDRVRPPPAVAGLALLLSMELIPPWSGPGGVPAPPGAFSS